MSGFDDAAGDEPLLGDSPYEAMPKSPARQRKERSLGFDQLVAEAVQGIKDFSRRTTAINRMAAAVGSKRDSGELRRQIAQELSVVANLAKDVEGQLRGLGAAAEAAEDDGDGPRSPPRMVVTRRKQQQSKLERDMGKAKSDWDRILGTVRRKLDDNPAPAEGGEGSYMPPDGASDDPDGALRLESGQLLMAQQADHNAVMAAERDEEIQAVAAQMADTQGIFRDLAEIVGQQQEDVDLIEDNALSANEKTEDGRDMLEQAEQKQKSTRKCLYVILGIVLVVSGVVVFLSMKKK